MSAAVVLMLVAGDAVVERHFAGESAFGEELERAIDGGETDLGIFLLDQAVELFGGEMIAGLEKSFEDGVALLGMLEADLFQVLMKDVGRLAEHLPREGRLIIDTFGQHASSGHGGQ